MTAGLTQIIHNDRPRGFYNERYRYWRIAQISARRKCCCIIAAPATAFAALTSCTQPLINIAL
ncbi:hypothetical protein KCP77_16535 [Salmonella enterica subsp. enterica]|nr:hypothetical protein KCP77_16535 [Salmonella enterica subsp. enterica]